MSWYDILDVVTVFRVNEAKAKKKDKTAQLSVRQM